MAVHNLISMSDRGVTEEHLIELFVKQNKSKGTLKRLFNVSEGVLNRWLKECNIENKQGSRYNFDIHFFDEIDTEEKAYWLGFVWCDGYMSERVRNGKVTERPLKISLARHDEELLDKAKISFKSNHEIKRYDISSGFDGDFKESRLTLNNMYFGKVLIEKYGMIPHRTNTDKLLSSIPNHLERHFLRGVLDAEGSIVNYYLQNGSNVGGLKSTIAISTYSGIIEWIQNHLIQFKLKENKVSTYKRHGEGSDGNCVTLQYAGVLQNLKILEHIYKDSNIYLERKYKKYLELQQMFTDREEARNV